MVYRKKTNKKQQFRRKYTKKNNKKYKGGALYIWTNARGQEKTYKYKNETLEPGELEPEMPIDLITFIIQQMISKDDVHKEVDEYLVSVAEPRRQYMEAKARRRQARGGPAEARGGPEEEDDGGMYATAEESAQARTRGAQASILGEASAELSVHASSLCACAPPPRNRRQSHKHMKMGDGTTIQKYQICNQIKQQIAEGRAPRANKTGTIPWPSYHALGLPTAMKHECGTKATMSDIINFVHSLPKLGLCMLTFSVGVARHSICVLFTENEMIVVDHYADNRGGTGYLHNGEDSWKQYNDLMNELEKQNKRKKLIFLPIDEELKFLGYQNQATHPTEGACEYYASNYWHIHKDDKGPPPPQAKKK